MDPYQRARSPSAGNSEAIRRSPSPHSAFTSQANALGYDPSLLGPENGNSTNPNSFSDALGPQQPYLQSSYAQPQYPQPDYSNHHQQQQQQQQQHQQQQHFAALSPSQQSFQYVAQDDKGQPSSYPDQFIVQDQQIQNQNFANFGDAGDDLDNPDFDSSVFVDFDNPVIEPQSATSAHSNTNNSNNMATNQRSPETAHLLQPDVRQAQSSSNPSSPSYYQEQDYNPSTNSRPNSLSPSSAVFFSHANGGGDFSGMAFRQHRRLPSDQHSEVSSTAASPYMPNSDSFEQHPSPMLNPTSDPSIVSRDNLDLSRFSISEPQHISPGHSSHPSPHLGPQNMSLFQGSEGLGMLGADAQLSSLRQGDSYVTQQELFPTLQTTESYPDIGQASQMSPPEIKFEPAPPSKTFIDTSPSDPSGGGALSPPGRVSSRNRPRSRSAPYASDGSSRESSQERPRSPSLAGGLQPPDSQSAWNRSRSQSPAHSGRIEKIRRSSSPAVPNVTHATLIAQAQENQASNASYGDRGFSPAPSLPSDQTGHPGITGPKQRVQKHPATYACTLCTKRFTRAYNLRSHLRTHTDERPFVCNVCGKAFARQHDRKRHEGLHSGEKKFVCRGTLAAPNSGTWGCGRRFARADALGRHFRSEAGRTCIKPLLDEEARERRAMMMDQANQGMILGNQNANQLPMMQQGPPMPDAGAPVDLGGMALPAALLQQYPALAEIQWNAPPAAARRAAGGNGGDASGASDFDESDYGMSDYGEGGEWEVMSSNGFGTANNGTADFGFEDEDAGYVSSSALDPRYAHAAGPWSLASGASNGYYSDNGGR